MRRLFINDAGEDHTFGGWLAEAADGANRLIATTAIIDGTPGNAIPFECLRLQVVDGRDPLIFRVGKLLRSLPVYLTHASRVPA